MKIVPSILAEKFDDFLLRLKQAEKFAGYVQIDLMDGSFVETLSFPAEEINSVATPLSFEVHLMAADPLAVMSRIDHRGLKKVIFHFEAAADHASLINKIKERKLVPGIAIKPETPIDSFAAVVDRVDTILFLTVDPCCYGHPFKPEVLKKVSQARKIFPHKTIAVDGGVSIENLKTFSDIGVDYACVGSRIFLKGDPGENYRLFMEKLGEMESKAE